MAASLKFDLSTLLVPLPVGATPSGGSAAAKGATLPWEALPLLIHRLVNLGAEEGRVSSTALLLVEIDRVVGVVVAAGGVVAATYLLAFGHAFDASVPAEDAFLIVSLVAALAALALHLVMKLFGRYSTRPASLSAEELRERDELHLPALLFNFQSFGTALKGLLSAFVVTLSYSIDTAAWAVLLYAAVSRMATHDVYEQSYQLVWLIFIFRIALTAVARCASFGELRSSLARVGAPLSAKEATRTALVCIFVCLSLCVVLPLGVMSIVYVRV